MPIEKRKLPEHGYLGHNIYATNKTILRQKIKDNYIIPKGSRIVIVPSYDKGLYEVQVIVPKKKTGRKK